jgi:signal transduction histidine kinase
VQYFWLTDLEEASTIARRVGLDKHLLAVAKEVEYFYTNQAERSLNLPAYSFDRERLPKVAHWYKKKPIQGAQEVFLINYQENPSGDLLLYDPVEVTLRPPKEWSPAVHAISMAVAPWTILRKQGERVMNARLSVDERDPGNRIILNPVVDEQSRLVGLVGMVLDEDYLVEKVLPQAITSTVPEAANGCDLMVTVRDGRGDPVFPARPPKTRGPEIKRHLAFIYTDWMLTLESRTSTSEQWARTNFAFNITLSGVLGILLLGGTLLALRTAAREMRLSEMKGDFVSNVSHELRTPLASIRVFAELMRLGRVERPEKVRQYGEYIETESRRLSQLINNILDFSKIESGGKVYQLEPTDLEEVVADAIRTFKVRLEHSGFTVTLERPPLPLPPMEVDRSAVVQAVCNLVDNAVKYSGDSRRVEVGLRHTPASPSGEDTRPRGVVIWVRDQGIGISREEQKKIFDRFHRVGTSLVHDVKGSGLGLAIVQHIAHAHGGRVTVESAPGEGSTFELHLPLRPQPRDEAAPASERTPRLAPESLLG